MRAGPLRHHITIEALTVTVDPDDGIRTEAWAPVWVLPAEILPRSAREVIAAAAANSKVSTLIVTRYRADVTARHRVVHRGRVYNIEGVVPDRESGIRGMTLMCSDGVNDG